MNKKEISGENFRQSVIDGQDLSVYEGYRVTGDLDLEGCTSLMSLPEGLSVDGDLDLEGCTSLRSFPNGLSVGGWLDLSGCTSLESLTEGLSVGGYLDLWGCTSLKHIPLSVSIKGTVYNLPREYVYSLPINDVILLHRFNMNEISSKNVCDRLSGVDFDG